MFANAVHALHSILGIYEPTRTCSAIDAKADNALQCSVIEIMLQATVMWLQSGRQCCLWSSYRLGSPSGPQGGMTTACRLPLKGERGCSRLWLPPPSSWASLSQVLTRQPLLCPSRLLIVSAAYSKGIPGQ